MERGRKYIGIANSALILAIFLQTAGIELVIIHYVLLVIAALVIYILVGFIDTIMGLRKMENFSNEQNSPVHMGTLHNTNEIKKLLKQILKPGKLELSEFADCQGMGHYLCKECKYFNGGKPWKYVDARTL